MFEMFIFLSSILSTTASIGHHVWSISRVYVIIIIKFEVVKVMVAYWYTINSCSCSSFSQFMLNKINIIKIAVFKTKTNYFSEFSIKIYK